MADIFISYAREDRALADKIAAAMTESGLSVFWDRTIPPGKTWREVIGAELEAAGFVIVLWSGNSVTSRWVQEEADRAAQRDILVPVLGEDVKPPLGFGAFQCADLSKWNGDVTAEEFRALLEVFPDGKVADQIEEAVAEAPNAAPAGEVVDETVARPEFDRSMSAPGERVDDSITTKSLNISPQKTRIDETGPSTAPSPTELPPEQSWNTLKKSPPLSGSPNTAVHASFFSNIPTLALTPLFVLMLYWVIGGLFQVDPAMPACIATFVVLFVASDATSMWTPYYFWASLKYPPVLEVILLIILTVFFARRRAAFLMIPAAGGFFHLAALIGTYAIFGFNEPNVGPFASPEGYHSSTVTIVTIVLSLAAVAANVWAFRILRAGR